MTAALIGYGTLIAALIGLTAWTLERMLAAQRRAQRFAWVGAILASFALPAGVMLTSPQQAAPALVAPLTTLTGTSHLRASKLDEAIVLPARRFALPHVPVSDEWLRSLWIAASVGLFVFLSASWIRLQLLTRSLHADVIDGVNVHVARRWGPAVFGTFKPKIIVPRWLVNAPQSTRAMVLAHERSHIAARDPLLFVAALCLICLVPWNIPLWWQLRRLRFAIEVDCDRRVLNAGTDVVAYGEMLLAVSEHNSRFPLGTMAFIEPASQLERRIRIMTKTCSRRVVRLLTACGVMSLSFVGAAAQLDPPVPTSSPPSNDVQDLAMQPRPLFAVSADAVELRPSSVGAQSLPPTLLANELIDSARMKEMCKRLTDPGDQAVFRAERRANMQAANPDLPQALGIESPLAAQLVELLTDQELDRAGRLCARFVTDDTGNLRSVEETDHLDRIRELLGNDRFQRYVDYTATLVHRMRAIQFDEQLDRSNKLSLEQKERLIALLSDAHGRRLPFALSTDGTQRTIRTREELMEDASRLLLKRLPEVLTPQQLVVFTRLETESMNAVRERIARIPAAARVFEATDDPQPGARPDRSLVAGQIDVKVRLTVNTGSPLETILRTQNGESVPLETPEGLWVDVTPTLFEDGWLDLNLVFYESKDRRAAGKLLTALTTSRPNRAELLPEGKGSSIETVGSKRYRITVDASVSHIG